jgi:hypothetical protein
MQTALHTYLDQIETKKSEIVHRAMALSDSDRNNPVPGGGWSAAQVIEHLINYEEYVMAGRQKALDAGDSLKPGFKGKLFTGMIRFFMRRKMRFGTSKEFEPPLQIDLEKRLRDWSVLRQTISEGLDSITASELGSVFTIHPIAGSLTAESTLALFSLHLDYHLRFFPNV